MLELGRHFRPVLELGENGPHAGTVPARGVFFDFHAPRAGTGRPVPELDFRHETPNWNWPRAGTRATMGHPKSSLVPAWGAPMFH